MCIQDHMPARHRIDGLILGLITVGRLGLFSLGLDRSRPNVAVVEWRGERRLPGLLSPKKREERRGEAKRSCATTAER